MDRRHFDELTAYMGSIWGRELSQLQRAGGWKLLHNFNAAVVGEAITRIADDGQEHLPTWPVVLKTARSIADGMRDQLPALPQGDSLTDDEHRSAMIILRAKQTPEQRRRADRMTDESKHLSMQLRVKLASELLSRPCSRLEAVPWDKTFERRLLELAR